MHVTTHKSTRNNEEDASKITKLHRNLNKDNAIAEEINKHKASKVKSEPHQDSFWMLRILIMFFKFLGLAAFAHHIITRKKRLTNTFQYSQLGIVYNVVLCSLLIASTYLSIPYILNLDYENRSNLTTGIEILQGILGTIVMCAILLSFCIDQKSLVRIANRLVDIEHEMDRLYHLYHRPLRRQRIFHALTIVCVLKIFLLISLVSTEHLAFDTGPVSWMSDIMPTFHVGWLLIQYYLLVSIIQADFVDVNQAIESLTSASTPDHQPQSHNQTRRVVVGNSTVHQLLQLQNVHCHLCEISEDVSEFYSLPVLFGFAFLFLTLIYNGYYLLSPLLMTDEILEYVVLSNTIIWLIFLIYPISLLTNRITRFLNEVSKTGSVVHSLLSCTIGKETKSELKQFSLQLLHRQLEFTANGYFALDNSFFHSLIGTVATYLVILVQFQMGSSGCSSIPECNCTKEDLSKVE